MNCNEMPYLYWGPNACIYIQPHSDYLSPCKNNVDEKPVQSVHYFTLQ